MKKLIFLLISAITAVSVYASSLTGQSYTCNWEKKASVSVMTLKFTSDTEGDLITVTKFYNGKSMSKEDHFSYQVKDDKLFITYDRGNTDVMKVEGNNSIEFSVGTFKLTFKKTKGSSSNKGSSSKKKSSTKRR